MIFIINLLLFINFIIIFINQMEYFLLINLLFFLDL